MWEVDPNDRKPHLCVSESRLLQCGTDFAVQLENSIFSSNLIERMSLADNFRNLVVPEALQKMFPVGT